MPSSVDLQALFSEFYPPLLAGLLILTAGYNLLRDGHVKKEMQQRGIPAWLRFPAIGAELAVAIILFLGFPGIAVILALLLLSGSMLLCLFTQWYRRLWLSVPLWVLTVVWLVQ